MTILKMVRMFVFAIIILSLNGCIALGITRAGVFKQPVKYNNKNIAYIKIPEGIYSKRKDISFGKGDSIGFSYLGQCGGGISFFGMLIPLIPIPIFNKCEKNGFGDISDLYLSSIGVTLQLYYNEKIYDSYTENGLVKFKITNFSDFKKANDKALIIHKKQPDGALWTKKLPFDWKTVVETIGGL